MSTPAPAATGGQERESVPGPAGPRRVLITAVLVAFALIAGVVFVEVWAHSAKSAAPEISVTGAYVPAPASAQVAAAYAVLHNSGAANDQLIAIDTDLPATASLHQDVRSGATETMVMLASLTIPAHGTAILSPGGDHIMILGLGEPRLGASVRLTLVFATSPPITLRVPVVPLGQTGPTP